MPLFKWHLFITFILSSSERGVAGRRQWWLACLLGSLSSGLSSSSDCSRARHGLRILVHQITAEDCRPSPSLLAISLFRFPVSPEFPSLLIIIIAMLSIFFLNQFSARKHEPLSGSLQKVLLFESNQLTKQATSELVHTYPM